ncbi:unnamed protein product, partial [Rhizoctonia solani]
FNTPQASDVTSLLQRNLASLKKATTKKITARKEAIYQDGRRIILSEEQKFLLNKAINDKSNLFFTGSAGTGKSVLLREVIQQLRGIVSDPTRLQVTASTGIAALNIGGITLHSFAGIMPGDLPFKDLLARIRGTRSTYHRWLKTEILVIDEISMLVVSGDFFQLPPVPEEHEINTGLDPLFAFEANCWKTSFPQAYKLTQVFRQDDTAFIRLLNELRLGITTDNTRDILNGLSRPIKCNDGILPTEIYPHRHSAQQANLYHLSRLNTRQHTYYSIDKPGTDRHGYPVRISDAEAMLEKRAPKILALQVGAQVMCTQNISDSNLVNGSVGRVINFTTPEQALEKGYPIAGAAITISDDGTPQRPSIQRQFRAQLWPLVKFVNSGEILMPPVDFTLDNGVGGVRARRRQLSFLSSYIRSLADEFIQIHRAQGQTIDRLSVNLAKTFAPGQGITFKRVSTH